MINREFFWYKLLNTQGFGVKSINYIYETLKTKNISVNDLFDSDINELYNIFPKIGKGKFSKAKFEYFFDSKKENELYTEFENLKTDGVAIIGLDDDRYPRIVKEKLGDDAPPILFCKGYLPLLNQPGVSIVGSRDVGDFEVTYTKNLAKKLAENGFNVISGYAKGVDTSAHLGALEAQGTTTMILSFGINHLKIKRAFKELNWEKNSLFVTQFAPYEKFSGKNAMIRNKLVCSMSNLIIVIKSGPEKDGSRKMSGTFDAGKSALKMKIPVFVLSPSVLNPAPQGNVDLIKLGGFEFSNVNEILKFLKEQPRKEYTLSAVSERKEPYQPDLFNSEW